MKLTTAIIALIVAAPAALIAASDLPDGAHDARPSQPRPNVCEDKCDPAFLKLYEQCKDDPDCVAKSRKATCEADYSCSTSCGYTAVGCANPAGWVESQSKGATSTTSCFKTTATSTATLTSTIPRPKLSVGLVAAEVQATADDVAAKQRVETTQSSSHNHASMTVSNSVATSSEPLPTELTTHSILGVSVAPLFTETSLLPTSTSQIPPITSSVAPDSTAASTDLVSSSNGGLVPGWNTNPSAASSTPSSTVAQSETVVLKPTISSTSTAANGNVTTITSRPQASTTRRFTQSNAARSDDASSSTRQGAAAVNTPELAVLGGLAVAVML